MSGVVLAGITDREERRSVTYRQQGSPEFHGRAAKYRKAPQNAMLDKSCPKSDYEVSASWGSEDWTGQSRDPINVGI
ncbi:hypothetical protein [Mesorhizobium sp. IMUNJ 23232]|uniref:hypothetical protein n=1 Tax=Mesorhizobium sp. IMUNJ 23232 TaxID=3376064 RepID=UPI00379354C2